MTVDGKSFVARSLTSCPRFGLVVICCFITTAARCPAGIQNSHVITVAELHPVSDNITRVQVVDRFNLALRQCQLVKRRNTILSGDVDSLFTINDEGLLHLNSSLNHTRTQLYTLEIGLKEFWRVGGDKTNVTIDQTACVEICVCPGKSTDCLDTTPTTSPVSTTTLVPSMPTSEVSATSRSSAVPASSNFVPSTPTSEVSATSHLSAVPTSSNFVSRTSSTVQIETTDRTTSNQIQGKTSFPGRDSRNPRDRVRSHPTATIEDQLRLAIVLAATVLAVAVLIILLMACQLCKKSRKRCCAKVETTAVSPDNIEIPPKRERSPSYELSEPPPDSELFYYYYAEMDSQVEAPGYVSSNRRELYHIKSNQNGDMGSRRHGKRAKDWVGVNTRPESSDKTAEWVDEQRRITERRTSMPTALDDASVESKDDDAADCLPVGSDISHPHCNPTHSVRANVVSDADFIVTNPLVKLSAASVSNWPHQRQASTPSLTSEGVRHGSNHGSLERPLPPVEDLS